jgi:hypothetical protein
MSDAASSSGSRPSSWSRRSLPKTSARRRAPWRISASRDLRLVAPREGWPNEKAKAAASGADHVVDRVRVFDTLADAIGGLSFVYATTARAREVSKAVVGPREAAAGPAPGSAAASASCSGARGAASPTRKSRSPTPSSPFRSIRISPRSTSRRPCSSSPTSGGCRASPARPRACRSPRPSSRRRANELIGMFEHLERALDDAGFFRPPERKPHLSLAIRAMFQRAGLTEQEVRTLRGMIAALERRPTRPHVLPDGTDSTERGKSVTILVFDSGIGGLSVAREVRAAAADGRHDLRRRRRRVPLRRLAGTGAHRSRRGACRRSHPAGRARRRRHRLQHGLDSGAAPSSRRARVPFVGTVPAVKPAAETTRSGLVSVLGTFGTMQREYTRALIQEHAGSCHVRLVGSGNLAPLAEAHMRGGRRRRGDLGRDRAGVRRARRRANGRRRARLHALSLPACPTFRRLAPWPVTWIDPAPAIARRVASVAGEAAGGSGRGSAYLTSGRAWPARARGDARRGRVDFMTGGDAAPPRATQPPPR